MNEFISNKEVSLDTADMADSYDSAIGGLADAYTELAAYLRSRYPSSIKSGLFRPFVLDAIWPISSADVGIDDELVWQPANGVTVVIPPYEGMSETDIIQVIWNNLSVATEPLGKDQINTYITLDIPSEKVPTGNHELFYQVTRQGSQEASPVLRVLVRFGQPGYAGTGEFVELPPPVLSRPVSGVIGEPELAAGICVTVAPYPRMQAHDRVHLFWGDEVIERRITADEVNKPVLIEVPAERVRAGGNSTALPIYYFIEDEVGNESEWSKDNFVSTKLNNDLLPPPIILSPDDTANKKPTSEIDLDEISTANLEVEADIKTVEGASCSVTLLWSGTTVSGQKVSRQYTSDPLRSQTGALRFILPNRDLGELAEGSGAAAYVVEQGGVRQTSAKAYVSFIGSGTGTLPAPSIHEVDEDWIEADRDPVYVVIPELAALQAGDEVSVLWRGTAADGTVLLKQPKTYQITKRNQGKALPIKLKGAEVLKTLDGGWVDVSYSVKRNIPEAANVQPLMFPSAPAGTVIMGISQDGGRNPDTERAVPENFYDLLAPASGEVYFYVNHRPGGNNANTGQINLILGLTKSSMGSKVGSFDALVKVLDGNFNEIGTHNHVKLYDTPAIWGQPFGKSMMPVAIKRQTEFQNGIVDILHKMQFRCDISSLNAPDAEWRAVILSAIDTALTRKTGRKAPTQIRFLFAQTPTVLLNGPQYYLSGTPEYMALKQDLLKLVEDRGQHWEIAPDIWIGRYYRIAAGLIAAAHKNLGMEDSIAQMDTRMTWNHTKIIAIDGTESFVGGHNLNMDLFTSYPPVHDVSVKVIGNASLHAQLFLNQLWETGPDLLTKEYVDVNGKCWVNADNLNGQPTDPLQEKHVLKHMEGKNNQAMSSPPNESGYAKADRVLSVGKYWVGPDKQTDYRRGSEILKESMIKNAKKTIRLSQQDLVSAWKKQWRDHDVCRWLIEALLANPELQVEIVVSPLDAAAGAGGDQYSFGSGARRTFDLFKYYLTHDEYTDELLADPLKIRQDALRRIKVAPFAYTYLPLEFSTEGVNYYWPEQDKAAHTASLREPSLADQPPQNGVIGHPAYSLLKGSGMLGKVASAPGNHAKVAIIDDEFYMVGSDNLYPGYLAEFSYIFEGEKAVKAFVKSYWEPLWKYSKRQVVDYRSK